MMKITYIEHSCYLIELNTMYLLFDYFKGNLPTLDSEKELYVFSSHAHGDHFSIKIFSLFSERKNTFFILSKDIYKKFNKNFFIKYGVNENTYNEIFFLSENKSFEIKNICVETLHSTDEGVAFIVQGNKKTIFHAGDLHWWLWKSESTAYNEAMTKDYKNEIEKIKGRQFDLAFLVLDSRQDEDFYRGFDYFMRNTDTRIAYPMHFWEKPQVIRQLMEMEDSLPYRNRIKDPFSSF